MLVTKQGRGNPRAVHDIPKKVSAPTPTKSRNKIAPHPTAAFRGFHIINPWRSQHDAAAYHACAAGDPVPPLIEQASETLSKGLPIAASAKEVSEATAGKLQYSSAHVAATQQAAAVWSVEYILCLPPGRRWYRYHVMGGQESLMTGAFSHDHNRYYSRYTIDSSRLRRGSGMLALVCLQQQQLPSGCRR